MLERLKLNKLGDFCAVNMFCSLHLCDRNQFIGVHMFEDYLYSANLMYIQVNLR